MWNSVSVLVVDKNMLSQSMDVLKNELPFEQESGFAGGWCSWSCSCGCHQWFLQYWCWKSGSLNIFHPIYSTWLYITNSYLLFLLFHAQFTYLVYRLRENPTCRLQEWSMNQQGWPGCSVTRNCLFWHSLILINLTSLRNHTPLIVLLARMNPSWFLVFSFS